MSSERWKPVGVVVEGDRLLLDGTNIWDVEWTRARPGGVEVTHPTYPAQRHVVTRYTLTGRTRQVEFAAGELSAGVWGVFVPEGSSDPE